MTYGVIVDFDISTFFWHVFRVSQIVLKQVVVHFGAEACRKLVCWISPAGKGRMLQSSI